jgi:hypothetical protein
MSITLTVGSTTIDLPPDLYWADELQWVAVEQAVERTITGALIVSVAARLAGRPFTLQPPDENSSWTTRTTLDQLRTWAEIPGQQMTLGMRGVDRTVIWRHHEAPVIDAAPIVYFDDVESTDFYSVTLRFMEI